MRSYQRILTIIDTCRAAEPVVRRAAQLALLYRASLAVACAVDYPHGMETDHVPFKAPLEMRRAIVADVRDKLARLTEAAGAEQAELIVAEGAARQVAADLVASWHPDLVVLSGNSPISGLEWRLPASAIASSGHVDVLRVQMERPTVAGRLVQALAYGF